MREILEELRRELKIIQTKANPSINIEDFTVRTSLLCESMVKKAISLTEEQTIDNILEKIEEEIKKQEKFLSGDFEKDKPVKWRIQGFEVLINKIKKSEAKDERK